MPVVFGGLKIIKPTKAYTIEQVAKILGVGVGYIRHLAYTEKRIKTINVNGLRYIDEKELDNFINSTKPTGRKNKREEKHGKKNL